MLFNNYRGLSFMKVDPFLVERFLNTYEHKVEYNLAETCVDPFILNDFLTLVGKENFLEKFQMNQLTYGFIEGSPSCRKEIAGLYEKANDGRDGAGYTAGDCRLRCAPV